MSEDATPAVRPRLRIMRIVHGALLLGGIAFAVIAIFLRRQGTMPTPEQPMVSFVGLILAATTLLVLLILPGVLAASWRKKVAAGVNPLSAAFARGRRFHVPEQPIQPPQGAILWWALYQTRLITLAAVLEGTVFLNLLAYLTEGRDWSLGVAGLFLLALALLFPTLERVEGWVRLQQELVEQQRGAGPAVYKLPGK